MTINYVILEENLNNLLFEKKIHNLRTALPNYILDRLRERVQIKMTDVGITSDAEALFLDAQNALDATFLKRLQDSLNLLGLSKNSIDYITKIAKRSRQAALDELKDKLLKAERIQFWKDAGISANKWKPFYECTEYTDQKTLDKIKQQLKLTDDQQKEFDRRVIARVFYVSGELRELVYDLLGKTGKKVEDFKIYAFIGKDAWESFYLAKDGKDKQAKTIIATTDRAERAKITALEKLGIQVLIVDTDAEGRVDIVKLTDMLGQQNICSILAEGGGSVHGSLIENHLVDRVYFFIAPKIIGGANAKNPVMGSGISALNEAVELAETEVLQLDGDILITGRVK